MQSVVVVLFWELRCCWGSVWIILVKSARLGSFSRQLCCELGIREYMNAESAILGIRMRKELGGGR